MAPLITTTDQPSSVSIRTASRTFAGRERAVHRTRAQDVHWSEPILAKNTFLNTSGTRFLTPTGHGRFGTSSPPHAPGSGVCVRMQDVVIRFHSCTGPVDDPPACPCPTGTSTAYGREHRPRPRLPRRPAREPRSVSSGARSSWWINRHETGKNARCKMRPRVHRGPGSPGFPRVYEPLMPEPVKVAYPTPPVDPVEPLEPAPPPPCVPLPAPTVMLALAIV